jgi:hypothetical protein
VNTTVRKWPEKNIIYKIIGTKIASTVVPVYRSGYLFRKTATIIFLKYWYYFEFGGNVVKGDSNV